jgi:AhpD family alkylhydroperoxidase
MQARIKNPAMVIPEAMQPLQALGTVVQNGSVPARTLALVHLRTSQINGCAFCLALHTTIFKDDETPERLVTVAAWRESPYFTDAERAALGLTEAVTRIADSSDPVPDEIWNEAARHYDERGLATLVLAISATNVWNRVNVATRQVAGSFRVSAEKATAAQHS